MGIDRIGKSPLSVATPASSGAIARTGTFEVPGSSSVGSTQSTTAVDRSAPLEQLRAGVLDRQGYVDAKIGAASEHLQGLPVQHLDSIRGHLRMLLATDPTLAALVDRATSARPAP